MFTHSTYKIEFKILHVKLSHQHDVNLLLIDQLDEEKKC